MNSQILAIIGSVLAIIIGLWRKFGRVAAEKRKQAEQARKDMDEAKDKDSPSSFLDSFQHLH